MTARKKMPWDARLIGILYYLGGALYLIGAVPRLFGFSRAPSSALAQVILFGLLQVKTEFWVGVSYLIHGMMSGAAGHGLIRGRAFGWWLMIIITLDGTGSLLVNFDQVPRYRLMPGVLLAALTVLWCIYRGKLYRPFGGRKDVEAARTEQ